MSLKLFKKNQKKQEEEEIKLREETKEGDLDAPIVPKKKNNPGELRLRKEMGELDLPGHVELHYPDPN
jgi:ubiquitin-conjugating enzyme E2 M